MSKRRDPVIAVLNYFEHTELPLAEQALALAQQIVKNRRPGATSRTRAKTKATTTTKTTTPAAGGSQLN